MYRAACLLLVFLLSLLPCCVRAQCSGFQSNCTACLSAQIGGDDPVCGYCHASQECFLGNAAGTAPEPPDSCAGQWAWTACAAPNCTAAASCAECSNTVGCGQTEEAQRRREMHEGSAHCLASRAVRARSAWCQPAGASASCNTTAACPSGITQTAQCAGAHSSTASAGDGGGTTNFDQAVCSGYSNCADCTRLSLTCGWCQASSSCVYGSAVGPSFGACVDREARWAFSFAQCAATRGAFDSSAPSDVVAPGARGSELAGSALLAVSMLSAAGCTLFALLHPRVRPFPKGKQYGCLIEGGPRRERTILLSLSTLSAGLKIGSLITDVWGVASGGSRSSSYSYGLTLARSDYDHMHQRPGTWESYDSLCLADSARARSCFLLRAGGVLVALSSSLALLALGVLASAALLLPHVPPPFRAKTYLPRAWSASVVALGCSLASLCAWGFGGYLGGLGGLVAPPLALGGSFWAMVVGAVLDVVLLTPLRLLVQQQLPLGEGVGGGLGSHRTGVAATTDADREPLELEFVQPELLLAEAAGAQRTALARQQAALILAQRATQQQQQGLAVDSARPIIFTPSRPVLPPGFSDSTDAAYSIPLSAPLRVAAVSSPNKRRQKPIRPPVLICTDCGAVCDEQGHCATCRLDVQTMG